MAIVWIHGDNLSPHNPALTHYPQAPALWVWDEELLAQQSISFKRLVFIYECLLGLPVVIRRGDVVQELRRFAQEQGCDRVITAPSPSPRFRSICEGLGPDLTVQIVKDSPFLPETLNPDLKRFFRYWKSAKPHLLRGHGED